MSKFAVLAAVLVAACSTPDSHPSAAAASASSPSPSAGASSAPEACRAPRDPQPPPAGGSITAAIALACESGAVAVGGGSVWVVPHLDRVVLRVDPVTNTVVDRIPLGDRGPGAEIAATDDMVWASVSSASYDFDRLVRIDPAGGSIDAWVDAAAGFPVMAAGFIWASGPRSVYRIDPATNTVAAIIEAGECRVIALDERVFCIGPSVAVSIDPTTDAVTPIPGSPPLGWAVAAIDGSIWGIDEDSLWTIDPETGTAGLDLEPPEGATAWSLDAVVLDGVLWTTASSHSGPSDRLVRIDRRTMSIDCVVETPTSEFGMAAGFGSIWLPVIRQPWLLRIDPTC